MIKQKNTKLTDCFSVVDAQTGKHEKYNRMSDKKYNKIMAEVLLKKIKKNDK